MKTLSRVLLIEPIDIVRAGLVALIHRQAPTVAIEEATTCEEALAAAVRGPWSLIVIEPAFPAGDGIELLRLVRGANPGTPLLVFSSGTERHMGVAAVRAGANGFLSKTAARSEIAAVLPKLAAGQDHVSGTLHELVCASRSPFTRREGYAALSNGELMVLRELGRGHTVKDIARTSGVGISTVGTYRARILHKLGLTTTADLVRFVVEQKLH